MPDNNIRLNSNFSSVAAFWKPESPNDIMTGNLRVDDDQIHFVTSPQYAKGSAVDHVDLDQSDLRSTPRIDVLHGFFDDGDCTLLQLMVVEHPGLTSLEEESQSIISTDYRAAAFIRGIHTGDLNDKCIDSVRYTFTSLAQWLITPRYEEWKEKHIIVKIPLEETTLLDFCVVLSRTHIQLKVRHELTTGEESKSRLTRRVAFVEVIPDESESLSWYFEIGNRLENLFSLLIGTSLAMETLFIYRGTQSGAVIKKQHEHVRSYQFFDSVRHTHSQLSQSIAIWMSESKGFREIENLLLGVLRKGKLFVETEFLSLAQALEGFHRATGVERTLNAASFKTLRRQIENYLAEQEVDKETATRINSAVSFANQTSFRSRLRELCGRVSESTLTKMEIDSEEFIGKLVRMRNFFTHAGGSYGEKEEPLRGSTVFLLSQKMRALLRIVFLLHLGFPEDQISELVIREATKWRVDS